MTDEKNIIGRLRSGYEFVKADEYPDRMDLPSIAEGKYKGVIGIGGLLLMRCPEEVKEDRDEYFRNLTNEKTKQLKMIFIKRSIQRCQSIRKGKAE